MKRIPYLLILLIVLEYSCSNTPTTLFELKSSSETNIHFNNQIIETDSFNILTEEYIFNGGGVVIGDFNNDTQSDILFTGNKVANKLYLNNGDFKFIDISKKAGIGGEKKWSTGATVVDINEDGWLDIYICAAMDKNITQRKNMLFVNQGLNANGVPSFKEMAESYGIDDDRNSMNATFFDYDRDGFLDLYVLNNEQVHDLPTNYRPRVNDGTAASNDRLYRNNGDGTFDEVTIEAGIIYEGFGLGLAVSDLNYDGWPDIHISNDYLTNDILYLNNGDGTFSNKIDMFLKHQSKFSMGSDISDYDNDGLLDIMTIDMLGESNQRMKTTIGNTNYMEYILNDRYGYQYQYMRNMLHKGNGKGQKFSEIGLLAGVSRTDWSWSPLFMDADNDGFRDLFITNGFPRDITDKDFGDFSIAVGPYLSPSKILDSIPIVKIANYAYRNTTDWTFENMGESWGLDIPSFSNGAAFADLDNDGDLDYIVNNINDEAFVFENTANLNTENRNNFLRIQLKGPRSNSLGIGTKVNLVYKNKKVQYYEHHLTRGYMSSVEPIIHFGLGSNSPKYLEILWPDGHYERLPNLQVNKTIKVNYKDAKTTQAFDQFGAVPKEIVEPILSNVTEELEINLLHKEGDFIDFNVQATLPHKLTQNGPCLAVGDLNGDTFEDIIVGSSANNSPILLFQTEDGHFVQQELFNEKEEMRSEEESIALFDIDNDGDLDIYLNAGSNEFERGSDYYLDRILINDGLGKFSSEPKRIPLIRTSGSVVKPMDFNNDGFVDVFVGGRSPMGQYPVAEQSFLLINENGVLRDITNAVAPDLKNVGMVTDATWIDYDGDQIQDLIVVGELMPITIFKNDKKTFTKVENTGIQDFFGWWESIESKDMDQDGDIDLVVGNLGSNNLFQPSAQRPVTVIAKDFDSNGSIDPITFAFFPNTKGAYNSYPVNFWGDINKQSPLFRAKFNYFKEYANATSSTLFSIGEGENSLRLTGNFDKSSYVENMGNGTFKIHPLPIESQLAPLNDFVLTDIDGDGNQDIIGVGNDFSNETFIGRYDALNGVVLKGNDKGSFDPVTGSKSGFLAPKDAKSIAKLKSASGGSYYFVAQNKGKLLVFKD